MMVRPFILCLALVACGTAPVQQVPESVAVRNAFVTGTESTRPSLDWWSGFADPILDSLITESRDTNHDLRAAAVRLQAAAAQAKAAGAPLYPKTSVGFNGAHQQQVFIGLPIPGAPGTLKTTSTSYGVSLDMTWELDVWGRLGANRAAAVADRQAALAIYKGASLSLAAQTAKAWFALIEARRQRELAAETVTNYETSRAQVEARYRRGIRPSLDLRLTQADLATARDRHHQAAQAFEAAARQLEVILGRYPAGSIESAPSLPSVKGPIPGGLPAQIVSRRPDLVAAERRLAASVMRVKAAKRARYPSISLTGTTGRTSGELSDLLDGDFTVWRFVGNIVAPLFQGGRIKAGIDLAEAQNEEALAVFASQVLTALAEVEIALAAEGYLVDRETALTDAAEQATAARRLSEDRYARGLTDLITVLSAQRAAYVAESQLLTVKRLRLDARVNLHLALGGGFSDRRGILSATSAQGS